MRYRGSTPEVPEEQEFVEEMSIDEGRKTKPLAIILSSYYFLEELYYPFSL